jgi:hypothetical protein
LYLTRHDGEGLVKRLAKRPDGSIEEGTDERELYREIIRRADAVRERAAESLARSRGRAIGHETLGDGG